MLKRSFSMFKRILLFGLMNIAVIVTVSVILNVLGVQPYLTANGIDYTSLLIFCLIWGSVGSFISLSMSKWTAKKFMGVQVIEPNMGGQYAALVNTVHRLAKAANLPKMPEVGIYQSPEVNAFATGPSKSNSLVAVSTGLLNRMDSDEVEGVLAHEIAHVANGDMVTMALLQGVINAFVMFMARIAAFALQNFLRGNSDNDREEGSSFGGGMTYWLTTMVFEMIFGIVGMIILAFFSRFREFRADKGGAQLAGRGKMIAALRSLQNQFENGPFDKRSESMSAFKISSKESGFRAMFSTHPPLSERIKALELSQF
jgi:heat shock protein HtpX